MGRSFIFYALGAIGLVIVASNANDIEGRYSEASMTETLLVIGGVLLFVLVARFAIARFNARRSSE
jgi:flagellar biogenesis protein FliO